MIHVAECHDLMFPLLAAKQPMCVSPLTRSDAKLFDIFAIALLDVPNTLRCLCNRGLQVCVCNFFRHTIFQHGKEHDALMCMHISYAVTE